jgi:hypothetical protein
VEGKVKYTFGRSDVLRNSFFRSIAEQHVGAFIA